MAEKTSKTKSKTRKTETPEITFRCHRCGRDRPIAEMRTVNRFIPALVVCQDCARELR
jgi:transcription elongation factor Elf1